MSSAYLSICKVISCLLLSNLSRRFAVNLHCCEVPQHSVRIDHANRLKPSHSLSLNEGELLSAFSVAVLNDEECKKCEIDILLSYVGRKVELDLVKFSEHVRIFYFTGCHELLKTLITLLCPIAFRSLRRDKALTIQSFIIPILIEL